MYDDPTLDDPTEALPWEPPLPVHPGANTGSGPWAPGYDPGANWNHGAPASADDPYANYNNGSPVNAPLAPGTGWEWSGPADPMWNMGTNSWDTGRWNQVAGRGLGYGAPVGGGGGTAAPRGAVAPLPPLRGGFGGGGGGGMPGGSGINVPGSTLPADILALFTKTPGQTAIQQSYQDALLKYMGRAQQTPSLDDPTLAPQAEVFRAATQRNTERQRRSAVERASATGQNQSGYLDHLIQQGVQDQGFQTAHFNANLLGGEMSKRRQELQSALQLARATGDAEAQRELQTRLAQVSAAMQQQGLNLQGQLGSGDLALRAMLGQMGNSQFYDQLGVNSALNMEGLNQKALQTILGGLG